MGLNPIGGMPKPSYKGLDDRVQKDVQTYFRYCPLCYSENAFTINVKKGWGGQDRIVCSNCGGKLNFSVGKWRWSFGKLESAELATDGVDGRGASLIGKREKPEFWQEIALKGRRSVTLPKNEPSPVMVKEVAREVVLIQCRSCGARYQQGTPRCLTCGANL